MGNKKTFIPVLIALIMCGSVGFSLYGYESPAFSVEAAQDEAVSKVLKPVKLLERPETENAAPAGSPSVPAVAEDPNTSYKDGDYYGSAAGFGGTIKVKVTISGGRISGIDIVSHSETASYLSSAKGVINSIIGRQSTNVDTVSGATYSSAGIIKAVRAALEKAKDTDNKSTEKSKKTEKKKKSSKRTGKVYPYPDGVYSGRAFGFADYVNVKLCLIDGRIEAIKVSSHGDDSSFFEKASKVMDTIMDKQSTDVDAVSGATYSSKGIIEAVEDALKSAKKSAERSGDMKAADGGSGNSGGNSDQTGNSDGNSEQSGDKAKLYKDGSYTASAICYPDEDEDFDEYELSLTMVIKSDKITEIRDAAGDGSSGNLPYIKRAASVLGELVKEKGGTAGIDAVSGATCTSKAFLEACTKALYEAGK